MSRSARLLRCLDIFLAAAGLLCAAPFLGAVWAVCAIDTRSPLFVQTRVGRHRRPFALYKFRTMRPGTASVATHLADASAITPLGNFLRRTKIDELPQLWNVLRGEMSLVGPRPCLTSQIELITAREALGVFTVRPGITGLAQLRGIDMSTPKLLAQTDAEMIAALDLCRYLRYIFATAVGKGGGDHVRKL